MVKKFLAWLKHLFGKKVNSTEAPVIITAQMEMPKPKEQPKAQFRRRKVHYLHYAHFGNFSPIKPLLGQRVGCPKT